MSISVMLDTEIFIHIFFIIAILIVFYYAYRIRNKYLKLTYAFVSILLYYYNAFIQNTVFLTSSGVEIIGKDLVNYSFWLAMFYFMFLGIYSLFSE